MDWTERQQLLFLVQSALLGMGIGLLFDGMTGIGRACRSRVCVFLLDVLFGALAALITFFASLAIMDGMMHPSLFVGGLFGFLAEHCSIGTVFSRLVCVALRWCGRLLRRLLDAGERFLLRIPRVFCIFLPKKKAAEGFVEKKQKKFRFFQKKT